MRLSGLILSAVWSSLACIVIFADEILAFDSSSLQNIERQHTGKPFIVAFWASDCAPCLNELELLKSFTEGHPEIALVLVSIDDTQNSADVKRRLASVPMPGRETWQFAATSVELLRYSVDPQWSGEVPRSYLYDSRLNRTAISGQLQNHQLVQWLGTSQPLD